MSTDQDSLRAPMDAAARNLATARSGRLGPPPAADPLDKRLVKRALFPRRAAPARVGRFTVLGLVGRGAMGIVYACYDDLLDRKVAVKLLHPAAGERDDPQARLLREAQALARLDHPNVVAVHDVGTFEDRVYLAMEFVDGQTLRDWLAAAPRTWRDVLEVILAAGEGLAAAHDKGLVHRDIKPDNIMVGADGRVRVMDFGLARAGDAPEPPPAARDGGDDLRLGRLTRTGAVMGTPAYMAPEQLLGDLPDARADQFALCLTAWEALFRRRAFAGDSLETLTRAVLAGDLGPAPRGDVPGWLRRVLERGLAREPSARYPDTRALLRALRADPTPRRQATALAAGALALTAGTLGALAAADQRTLAACEAAASALSAEWRDDRREGLELAFLATGTPFASAALAHTLPWLDRWVAAWHDATLAACRAHRLDHAWDDDLRARADDCLDEARGNFIALVDTLSRGDATALTEATAAAAALPGLDACTDPARLRERPLARPDQQGALLAARAPLARAASLAAAGRYRDGLPVARDALAAAEALGWPGLVAQARLRVAALEEQTGAYADSEADLRRVLADAGAAGDARLALAATTQLVYLVGYRATRRAEAEVWADAARLQLALLPGPHPLERSELDSHLAAIRYTAGDYGGAAELYAAVLDARIAALGERHPHVAVTLGNLASARFAGGERDQAVALHRRALAIQEDVLGPDHPLLASNLNNLALAHEATGEFAEATRLLERALAIREAALGPDHPLVAASLDSLGLVREATGDFADAARLLERALAILEAALGPDHPTVAATLHNLASVRLDTGDLADAARLLQRALAIEEAALGPDHPNTTNSLAGLALVHHAAGDLDESLRLNARALAAFERQLGPDHPNLAHVLVVQGDTLRRLGRPAEAVPLLERARRLREAHRATPEELAELRFTLARALWDAGLDRPRARRLAEQARADFATTTHNAATLAELQTWLESHPA